jgi:hypothetical protein
MGRARILQSNFTAGEFSERLLTRSDLQRFFSAVRRNENFQILTQGGVAKRSGTLVAGRTPGDGKALLVAFVKSATDALMLELSALKMRVWRADRTLATAPGGAIYELATPWAEADLPALAFTQAADVVFVTRRDCAAPVMTLRRDADADWTLAPLEVRNGPFLPLSDPGVTLAASGTTGAIVLTASAPVFSPAKVGAIYRLRENVGNPAANRWEQKTAVVAGERRQNGGRVYEATAAGTTGTTPPIHWEGAVSDGAVTWAFVHDGAGVALITGHVSATSAQATVLSTLPSTAATTFWEEGAFSAANGWPAAATIHQERLFLGQTRAEPDTLHASATAGYGPGQADFKPGLGTGLVVDSDAVKRTLTGGQVRPILHLVSAGALYCFTPRTVEVVSGPSDREPITPAGAAAISRPGFGASPWVSPVRGADEILYVSWSGRRVLALPWGDVAGDGRARDVTVLAEHLGRRAPFVALALVEDPEPTLFALNARGELFGMAYASAQEVAGWWRLPLGGGAIVESIAVLPRPDGREELWLAVARDGRRTIEHLPGLIDPLTPRDLRVPHDGAYFWDQWNADPARTATLTGAVAAGGALPRGATGAVATNHDRFVAGDVGREVWLRRDLIDGSIVRTEGPVRLKIDAVSGPRAASVTALVDAPPAFIGAPLVGHALSLTRLTGASLWASRPAAMFGDGEDLGEVTPDAAGAWDAPRPTCRGFLGAPFGARLRLMPLDAGSDIGTAFGGLARPDRLTVLVHDAVQLSAGPSEGRKDPLFGRRRDAAMSAPPTPGTVFQTIVFPGGWSDPTDVELEAPGPWPCELAGAAVRVTVHD